MLRLLVVLMLSRAYASQLVLVKEPPPPYSESQMASQDTFKQVLQYLGSPIASVEQRNFAIFALATDTVAQSLANGNDFEQAYSSVDMSVKLAQLAPNAARKLVLQKVKNVLELEKPMTRLIDKLCNPGSPVGTVGRRCDELVDRAVREYPWFQPHATILLDAGKFSCMFKKIQEGLEKAIKDSEVREYLKCNKYALKPFVTQISKLVNLENKVKGIEVTYTYT